MLFNLALTSHFCLAFLSVVLAVPSSRHHLRVTRRRGGHRSQLSNRYEHPTHAARVSDSIYYNSGWAGTVRSQNEGTFTSVTGTFIVPHFSGKKAGDAASIWVGIDGDTCQQAILQTGVDLTINDGVNTYTAWSEWYPEPTNAFTGIDISPGDRVKLTVNATSLTTGIATVENLTNGQKVSQMANSTYALCKQDAEWIVENFESDLANFTKVTFTHARAGGAGGEQYTPPGATIMDIQLDNKVLTSTSINGSSVTIEYV